MQGINAKIRKNPKRVIFAEGEDENMLKAAIEFGRNRLGKPILIGSEKRIREQLKKIGLDENYKIDIVNSTDKDKREKYVKHLYQKLQREGQLERDVDRLVRNDRIAWGSSMIACKDADAMVTGNIRHYAASIEKLKKVVEARPGEEIFGMTMIISKGKTVLVADTNVTELPSADRLVNVSKSCVRIAKLFGFDPKVAFLSHSTFGKPISSFQAISFKLADMATQIEASQLLIDQSCHLKNEGLPMTKESAMAKYYASEVSVQVSTEAIQIFGGYGYTKDFPVEKFYRDSKLCTIGEGTSEIQKLVISRHILKD